MKRRTIYLIGEPRGGGYLFIRSPELPGFSMMLDASQYGDSGPFMDAIEAPLTQFILAEQRLARRYCAQN